MATRDEIVGRAVELGRPSGRFDDAAVDELLRMAERNCQDLESARTELLGRLHRDSADHDATRGLLLVEAALAHCLPRTGFLGEGDVNPSD